MTPRTSSRSMNVLNARRRLQKALALIQSVHENVHPEIQEELTEALSAASDFTENAINKLASLRRTQ